MTSITGTLKDSGGNALSGELQVTLDAPLVDSSTTPDSILLPRTKVEYVDLGVINLSLPQSETISLTYRFVFNTFEVEVSYYFNDGEIYTGPRHQHTDSKWYTGDAHSSESQVLSRLETQKASKILDFRAIVPNVAAIEFAALLPTGITTDVLDTSIRRLAQVLTSNSDYAARLRGGPTWMGAYNASTYYKRDDAVEYNGSSWIYVYETTSIGQTPSNSSSHWDLLAKGAI